MKRSGPTVARYAIVWFLLVWVAFSQFGVVVFAYNLFESAFPWVPALPADSVVAQLTRPSFLVGGTALFVATAAVGRRRYGSLAAFTVACAERLDSVFGWALFDEPLLVGRIEHDGVGWRFEYREGGHVELLRRECPVCGLELVERMLRRDVVHGPNTGFAPDEDTRETADEAWEDVFGQEKADDHGETLALACPKCNVSVPGRSDVVEGKDAAVATFRRHAERMQSTGTRGDPFADYETAARERVGGDPSPGDVWDAYVRRADPDGALFVDPTASDRGGRDVDADSESRTEASA
jgi:hypothetical protein